MLEAISGFVAGYLDEKLLKKRMRLWAIAPVIAAKFKY